MLIWSGRRDEERGRYSSDPAERLRYLRTLGGQKAFDAVAAPNLWCLILSFLLPGYEWKDRTATVREILSSNPKDT